MVRANECNGHVNAIWVVNTGRVSPTPAQPSFDSPPSSSLSHAAMDQDDPISTFFPDQEEVDLYAVLSLDKSASADDIKKAYRRLALKYHPDKHSSSSQETRDEAATMFQQVGFAYAVLSDDKRRVKYDRTGRTDEGLALEAGEGGWDAYFEELFDRVTKGKLDEMKKSYQGVSRLDSGSGKILTG